MQLKHQLRDALIETLNVNSHENPAELEQYFIEQLHAHGIILGQCETPATNNVLGGSPAMGNCRYGVIEDISVEHPSGSQNLIAITTTLGIPCGTDSSLYLLRKGQTGWELIFASESNGYKEITGAYGAFRYQVSPPDANGQFFIVTANITPWCSSNWQGLRYQAFRVGTTPYEPIILLQRRETIYVPSGYAITIQSSGFRLEFWGNPGEYKREIDPDATGQTHIFLYDIVENQVREAHLMPENFLDKWLEYSWEEASTWIAQPSSSDLKNWHKQLREDRQKYWIVYSCYERCPHNSHDLIMGITIYRDNDPKTSEEEIFFTLTQNTTGYALSGFYRNKPSNCPEGRP